MKERETGSSAEEKGSWIFGKGTFGRKALITLALLAAGFAVGVPTGRELASLSSI